MGKVVALAAWPAEQIAFPFPETFAGTPREKSEAPILTMDTGDTTEALLGAIRDHFDGSHSPVKRLARIANCNTRSAENWWHGKNLPDVVHFLRLMAQIPELAAEVRRLTGLREDADPEFEQALHKAMAIFMRRRGGER
jgi:hypothetical protein